MASAGVVLSAVKALLTAGASSPEGFAGVPVGDAAFGSIGGLTPGAAGCVCTGGGGTGGGLWPGFGLASTDGSHVCALAGSGLGTVIVTRTSFSSISK